MTRVWIVLPLLFESMVSLAVDNRLAAGAVRG